MTRWVRPNPACEHNGGLMMWVRLMGGYHWQHCPLAGHRTLGTKYRLAAEGVEGAGWLGRSVGHLSLPWRHMWTWKTPTHFGAHTQINTCFVDTHLNTFRTGLRDWTSACGAWSAALSMTQPWLNGTDFVCVCVFCGLITLWCSSFTLGVIDTPV